MPRTKPNYLNAIASVALVLFVLGFFALTALHGRKLVSLFKEKVDIWLELKPNLADNDVRRIVAQIRQNPMVKSETVTFVTKEQAMATMQEDLGDDSMLEDMPDLLRDVIRFNVKAEYLDDAQLTTWRETLKQDTLVSDLYFEAVNTANVSDNIRNLGMVTLLLSLLLIFTAVTLIHNTIRLAMYSNRFLIKSQELKSMPAVWQELGWKTTCGCHVCRPALNFYLLADWPLEYQDDPQSRFINERKHANIQKDGTFSVVPRMWGGMTTPNELRAIADAAEKYNVPTVHVTGGQRIDLLGVKGEDLPAIWADLNKAGLVSGHAYSKGLRTVKTCVGSDHCRFGTQDSTGLGIKLEKKLSVFASNMGGEGDAPMACGMGGGGGGIDRRGHVHHASAPTAGRVPA